MQINKKTLPNGLRIITIPMADNPAVTVLVMVETGSKYETKDKNGISHFLEHMMFKGTPRRPKASDISRELDGIGAQYNAFTGYEYTGYYAKADKKHIAKVLDIVSDLYLNPLFDEKEMEKEKGVIIEEIRMYQDMPQSRAQRTFMECMFGDQPVGWDIAGPETNIKSFQREDFVNYRNAHYVAGATTVIVAGAFDEAETLARIESSYGTISTGAKGGKIAVAQIQTAPQVKIDFKKTDQTHITLGFRTFSILDPRIPTLIILSTILGRGMSSRLFSRMRDELGVCYYINTSHDPFTDHGLLSISAGVDNTRVEEAVKEILAQIKKLTQDIVQPAELQKAKDYASGTMLLELETSESRAEFAGYQEIMKQRVDNPDTIIARLNAVTTEQVHALAKEIFIDATLNMAVVGNFTDPEIFKKILTVEN
jgi:predicted Zn-dependent peptidase